LSETAITLLRNHKDIGEVGEYRLVGDEAGEPDLGIVAIEAEGEGTSDCPLQRIERDAARAQCGDSTRK
jgi:hypothetical protein